MYLENSQKKMRGPVFTVAGSFVLVFSTSLMIFVNGDVSYLGLALMALGMAVIADLGFRSKKTLYGVLFFSVSGGLLAAVATVITIAFPEWMSAVYSVFALVGSILVLKGIHDVQGVKNLLKREQSFSDVIRP
jgi:archaellum biogenesis protein FlaJ (TadC family)